MRYNPVMITTSFLPDSVFVQYSELLQQCVYPAPDGSNISFKFKTIRGKRYWYLYISLGARRSEHYLGEESPQLLSQIEQEKQLWYSTEDDRKVRSRLVAMLIAGGAYATPVHEGKVIALLEKAGVFLMGGVIVGTLAFRAYANMLGVQWRHSQQTRDIDIATDPDINIAIDENPVSLDVILLTSGMGFFAVPALSHKSPSTRFKVKGQELVVDLLSPMTGKTAHTPVFIKSLNTYSEPVRYLDYLLKDVQTAVLLFRNGLLINVPNPARFALHKLVVSQRRPLSHREKIYKDLSQAEQLLEVLLDIRPGDITLAREAAESMGDKFVQQMQQGIKKLPARLAKALEDIDGFD